MTQTFDAGRLLATLPSFYRSHLGERDLAVLKSFWEGLVRVVDSDYAALFDLNASTKLTSARQLAERPWFYRTTSETSWTYRKTEHSHITVRVPGNSTGLFYFGRYLPLESVRLYWDGLPVTLAAPSFMTNEPNAAQLAGTKPMGTRLELRTFSTLTPVADTATWSNTAKQLTAVSDCALSRSTLFGDGVVSTLTGSRLSIDDIVLPTDIVEHQAVLTLRRRLSPDLVFSFDTSGAYVTSQASIVSGQVIELQRESGLRHRETVTALGLSAGGTVYTWVAALTDLDTDPVTAVAFMLDWRWRAPVITETAITFVDPLPAGLRLRVTDPGGVQVIEIGTRPRATFPLQRPVAPDLTNVFLGGVDLSAITVTTAGVDFGRAPSAGWVWELEAPQAYAHDHARFSFVAPVDLPFIPLPATRPLALLPDYREDPRYPVQVYLDAVLQPTSAYSFDNTLAIRLASGDVPRGTVVEVVYVDVEAPVAHRHMQIERTLATGEELSSIALTEPVTALVAPIVETDDGLIPAAALSITDATLLVRPAVTSATFVRASVTYPTLAWELRIPHAEETDGRYAALVAAEALQDGIDYPTTAVSGDQLEIVREESATRVRATARFTELWFKNAQIDERMLQEVLGAPAQYVAAESSAQYQRTLTALYAAMYGPSTAYDIENFACIIAGADYVPKPGLYSGVVTKYDGTRVMQVKYADGTTGEIPASTDYDVRVPPRDVPVFHAPERRVRMFSGDLADVPYLVFFAEEVSEDYRYAKRLDVWESYDLESTDPTYDEVNGILSDPGISFVTAEIKAGDLIRIAITGSPNRTVYGRILRIIDDHSASVSLTLAAGSEHGWGEPDGWGESVGWGGLQPSDVVSGFTVYGRQRRRVDVHLASDAMPGAPLSDGETVAEVNAKLAALLSPFMFALRVDWQAATDLSRLDDLHRLISAVKPADSGFFLYAQVNDDDGIEDSFTGKIFALPPALEFPPRLSFVGQDFIGSFYIAPATTILPPDDATLEPTWFLGEGSLDSGEVGGETEDQTARFITVF